MKLFTLLFVALLSVPTVFAQSSTISWTSTYQTIDGFGASTGYNEINPNLTSAQADCFFSATLGSCSFAASNIGLQWIRIQDSGSATNVPDMPTLLLAQARGAKVFLSFATNDISSSNFVGTAAYMVNKVKLLQQGGLTISAISPMNEPGNGSTTPAAFDTFIVGSLAPAFASAGVKLPPIVLGESANWFITDFVTPCLNDAACAALVPTVAGHAYYYGAGSMGVDGFSPNGWNCCVDYAANPVPSSVYSGGKKIWMTEVEGSGLGQCSTDSYAATYDPSMTDALVYAHNIHDFFANVGGSAWMFWNMQAETSHSLPDCNDGITSSKFVPAQRYYAIGNWSKFVRSGWVRIGATANPASGIYITAFKEAATGKFAIVAINRNSSAANVSFSLSAFPSVGTVTPTLTSASADLADQPNVDVTNGAFSYSLPEGSVVTFHGTATTTTVTNPNPPKNLAAVVQ